jgi:hypothetical protein
MLLWMLIILTSVMAKLNNKEELRLFTKNLPPSLSRGSQWNFFPHHTVISPYSISQTVYIWINSTMEEINEIGLELRLYGVLHPDYPRYELDLTTIEFIKCPTGSPKSCVKLPCEIRQQFPKIILKLSPYEHDNYMEIMVSSWNDDIGLHLLAKYEEIIVECVDVKPNISLKKIIMSELMSNKQIQSYSETINSNLYEYYNGGIINKELQIVEEKDLLIHIFQSFNAFTQVIIKCIKKNTTFYDYQDKWILPNNLWGWFILVPDIPLTMNRCFLEITFKREDQKFKFDSYWFFMQQFIPKVARPEVSTTIFTNFIESNYSRSIPSTTKIPEEQNKKLEKKQIKKVESSDISDVLKMTTIILAIASLEFGMLCAFFYAIFSRRRFNMLNQEDVL